MKNIKIGWIGLGARGTSLLRDVVLAQNEQVTAVCDLYEDRCSAGAEIVEAACAKRPAEYADYNDVIADDNVTVIIIATAWESHIEIAVAAMNAGKVVAMEVGGAYSLEQCRLLVETYEKTKTPFMFLENCCFGRREMMALNMAEKGLFGEIVHCEGCYAHDLRHEISYGRENRHYRLRNYLTRNCENYPTHELGPISKALKINKGNRMLSLTSFSSKSVGLRDYVKKNKPDDDLLQNAVFAQGDIITTVIKCANGETILLKLDTTLPRYYSRGFVVRGTNGMYEEVTDSVFLDTEPDRSHDFDWRKVCIGNAEKYQKEWEHPIWQKYIDEGVQGTHDGMDWLEFKLFFNALRNNEPMPIDVYDAAAWMSITVLSEMSIAKGGAVMDIPDFTNGKWHMDNHLGYSE